MAETTVPKVLEIYAPHTIDGLKDDKHMYTNWSHMPPIEKWSDRVWENLRNLVWEGKVSVRFIAKEAGAIPEVPMQVVHKLLRLYLYDPDMLENPAGSVVLNHLARRLLATNAGVIEELLLEAKGLHKNYINDEEYMKLLQFFTVAITAMKVTHPILLKYLLEELKPLKPSTENTTLTALYNMLINTIQTHLEAMGF